MIRVADSTKCYVVTEGPADAALLSALIGPVFPTDMAEIIAAGGRSPAVSLARSLLAVRPNPVALVVDTHSTNDASIAEQELILRELLGSIALPERFQVFLAVPEIESCLFQDEQGLKRFFGAELSQEALIQGRYEPKRVLENLLQGRQQQYSHQTLQTILDKLELDRLRSAGVIRELLEFLESKTVGRDALKSPAT